MLSLTRLSFYLKWQQVKSATSVYYLKLGLYRSNPLCKAETCPNRFIQTDTTNRAIRTPRQERLILDNLENEFAVSKDTLLYRYENKRFIKLINIFAMCQFVFWSNMSYTALTMKDTPVPEEDKDKKLSFWQKMNMGKYKVGIAVGSFLVGWGALAICWTYTLRCVQYLVLKKGGHKILVVTHTPFFRKKFLEFPLKEVSAKQSRASSTVHLPLKVKGKYMHFLLDMRGEFPNTRLFDYSAGLSRNWSK